MKRSSPWSYAPLFSAIATAFLLAGCKSNKCCEPAKEENASAAAPAAAATAAAAAKPVLPTFRIKAGDTTPFTDSNGNAWLGDQGFDGGDTISRGDMQIGNTKDPIIYRSERYSMGAFSQTLPNGKYTVKLHFAETFEEINGAGQRVFTFNVEGKEFKDFDVFVKAGGAAKAYIESVNVDVADGKLDITFTSNIQNPEINGIEIIPQ
jgi:hypothetical protein